MQTWPAAKTRSGGFSLVEMMAATTIMAVIMASVVVVMRSGYAAWNAHEADLDVCENGYAVLNFFVREMRQAQGITVITAANNTAGSLSYSNASGVTQTISINTGTKQVSYNDGTTSNLLAGSINQMSFTGYKADGTTATTTVDDIQMVKCTIQVTLAQGAGVSARTISTTGWLRAW